MAKNNQQNKGWEEEVVNDDGPNPEVNEENGRGENQQKASQEKTVEIAQKDLDAMMARIQNLESNQKDYEETATQDQIARIEQRRASGEILLTVRVDKYEGKLVLKRELIENEVYKTERGLEEKQTLRLTFQDDSTKDVNLLTYYRNVEHERFEVVDETKSRTGETFYTLKGADGIEFRININYVN